MQTEDLNGFTECEKVIISNFDKREYSLLKLDNEMQVLLISDKDTEKSAASITMRIGSLDEPKEFLGLAHFLEHMLFLGSKKYPNPSEYEKFFTECGGSNNAYTDDHRTVYAFDCSNDGFYEGLDRTSDFFKHPLFDEKYTEKEINAVNSEFIGNQQSDQWRKYSVLSSVSDPKSFANRFTIGNKETLMKPGIGEALLDFHAKYYSSNIGFACLYNNQPLETMRKYAIELLSGIENKKAVAPNYKDFLKPYGPEQMKKQTKIEKTDDGQDMTIYFTMPFYSPEIDSSLNYITNAIVHRCKGSIYDELFEKGWVTDVTAGHDVLGKNNSISFYIELTLTKKGQKEYDQIASAVCGFLEMLRTTPAPKWFHDELELILTNEFEYLKKDEPYETVEAIAGKFGIHKNEHLLNHDYHFSEFNSERITEQLSYLTYENSIILLSAETMFNEGDDCIVDYYFQVKYQTSDYDENLQSKMSKDFYKPEILFSYPPANYYIARNFDLQCETEASLKGVEKVEPTLILSEKGCDIWYKPDITFKEPRLFVYFQIFRNDNSRSLTPEESVMSGIWVGLLEVYLTEEIYQGELACCELDFEVEEDGIQLSIECFNDSILHLIEKISKKIASFKEEFDEEKFDTIKNNAEEELNSFWQDDPGTQARHYLDNILNTKKILNQKLLKAHDEITFEGYKKYCKDEIWSKLFFQCYFSGNIAKENCIEIYTNIRDSFNAYKNFEPLERTDIIQFPILNFAKNETSIYRKFIQNEDDKNSAIAKYYQMEACEGDTGTRTQETYTLNLINHFISDRFYSQLRTEQQLGYTVYARVTKKRGHSGITFVVKGDVQDPNYVSEKITEFLESQMTKLEEQSEEDFEKLKSGYSQSITVKSLSLSEEAETLFYQEIYSHLYNWDYIEKLKEIVPLITKDDAMRVYKKVFLEDKKVFEVHMVSTDMKDKYNEGLEKRTYKNLNKILKSGDVLETLQDKHAFREINQNSDCPDI